MKIKAHVSYYTLSVTNKDGTELLAASGKDVNFHASLAELAKESQSLVDAIIEGMEARDASGA